LKTSANLILRIHELSKIVQLDEIESDSVKAISIHAEGSDQGTGPMCEASHDCSLFRSEYDVACEKAEHAAQERELTDVQL
jgi:hypothetical protein